MQLFTLLVEQPTRVSSGLQGITERGQPHEPHRVLEVFFAPDMESDPARAGNQAVLLGKTFRQEGIANRARKRYINHAALVHVPYLGTPKSKFLAAKTVGANRYTRPRGNLGFEPLQMLHTSFKNLTDNSL